MLGECETVCKSVCPFFAFLQFFVFFVFSGFANFRRPCIFTLFAELEAAAEPEPARLPPPKCRKRITLRLPDKDRAYLEAAAAARRGSVNDAARDIIQSHISQHPILSAHEADALSQSNYQLVMIGRNLNQIARRLNAGENVSLSGRQIDELKRFIEAHVGKVNHVLQTNRRRKRE